VISSSPAHFGRFQGLAGALAAEGYRPVHFGPRITLYQRGNSRTCPFTG
jgi:hypothetical protein